MTSEQLTMMEEIRKKKENYLDAKGAYSIFIAFGSFASLACIYFLLVGLATGVEESVEPTTTSSSTPAICYGVYILAGIIGVILVLLGILRWAKYNRDLRAREGDYQQLRMQVNTLMEGNAITPAGNALPPEVRPERILIVPPASDSSQQKMERRVWIIAGCVGVVLIFMCAIAGLALVLGLQASNIPEQAPINSVLDEFMKDMVAEDIMSAFELFSPNGQRGIYPNDLTDMIEVGDKVLFVGYDRISADKITLDKALNNTSEQADGLVARVTGKVYYQDGKVASFTASLETVEGEWRLYSITLNEPMNNNQP